MTASSGRPDSEETLPRPEVWAGVECSRLRVGERTIDQLALTGHDRRLDDLDLLASLGARAIRYPVLWERVAPSGLARADWTWTDQRMKRLRSIGLRPIIGLLHHGQGPRGMSILHPGFVAAFAAYASAVARRYPWVSSYMPINEPLTTARFGGLYGWWPPYARSEPVFGRMILTQVLATRAAARAIAQVNGDALLIVNEDVGRVFSTAPLAQEAEYLNERRWLTWDLMAGRVTPGHPMYDLLATSPENERTLAALADEPFPPDILGIDHYVTSDRYLDHRVGLYPAERRDPACPEFVDVEACRVRDVPAGSVARAVHDTWQRYGRPMALTEISMDGQPHDQVAWWNEAWAAATEAVQAGMDVRAVTAWAAFGATDWHTMMRRQENRYEPGVFDASSSPPLDRPVADAIRASASARATLVSDLGWWTKPNRYLPRGPM